MSNWIRKTISRLPLKYSILPWPDFCNFTIQFWLLERPEIANAIIWETPEGPISYPEWSYDQKKELDVYFFFFQKTYSQKIEDPPQNQIVDFLEDTDYPDTALSPDDAWSLYLAHISNSLYLERVQDTEPIISWSLTEYSNDELKLLLDSRSFFEWHDHIYETSGYLFPWNWWGLPSLPDIVHTFLNENDLIAPTRTRTVGRILEWCNIMSHFLGGFEASNVEAHWQYRGLPPATRIIEGTINTDHPEDGMKHYTAGCHGTSAFLASILRVINIPAKYINTSNHATPGIYTGEWKYLSHGDDPYNRLAKCTPQYPGEELLIDQAKWDSWFGDSVTEDERRNNISRQVRELALIHIPNYLMILHCDDLANGRTHEESEVFDCFDRWYTVTELEDMDLWTRIEDKIGSFGGCDFIPTEY